MLRSRMPSQGASRHAGSLPRSLQIPAATGCRHKALHNAHPLTPLKQARASFPLPPSRAAGSMAEATASLDVPWVVPPAPSSAPDSSTSLLVLVPGTMLGPSDYIALAAALQVVTQPPASHPNPVCLFWPCRLQGAEAGQEGSPSVTQGLITPALLPALRTGWRDGQSEPVGGGGRCAMAADVVRWPRRG